MGFFDFFRREKRGNAEIVPECDDVLLRALISGSEIDENTAMSIPALAGAIGFIADTAASLPVKLYRDSPQSQTAEEITNDRRLILLNDEGGDLLNAYEAKKAQIKDMLLHGAGYMHIQRKGNNVVGLRYVDRAAVSVSMNADPIFKEAVFSVGGKGYYPWDFVTLTRGSKNGVTGVGLLRQMNELLGTSRNEMLYENNIAKTGGNKKGFLQSERKLTQEAMDKLKAAWRQLYSVNGNNMMILNDGVKYQQAASTSVEMQLNEHKVTNSGFIMLCLGLNPSVISGSANTEEYMSAIRTAVIPVVEAYQAALNRSLLLESEKPELYFVLDTTELLKGDMVSRFNAYAVGLQNNFLRIDEVRYKENLAPIGFNYIKLGLQDVLLDPETGEIYTPNTNQLVNVNERNGSTTLQSRHPKPGRQELPPADAGQTSDGGLTSGGNDDIIEDRARHYTRGGHGYFTGSVSDGNSGGSGGKGGKGGGRKSSSHKVRLSKKEYGKIVSEINTNYSKYKDNKICYHNSFWNKSYFTYKFLNKGFDDYDFLEKW